MVQKLLTPTDEVFSEHKRKQLMELASINGEGKAKHKVLSLLLGVSKDVVLFVSSPTRDPAGS